MRVISIVFFSSLFGRCLKAAYYIRISITVLCFSHALQTDLNCDFLELHVLKCAQIQNIRTRLCRRRFSTRVYLFRFSFFVVVVVCCNRQRVCRFSFYFSVFLQFFVQMSTERRGKKICRHLQQTQANHERRRNDRIKWREKKKRCR